MLRTTYDNVMVKMEHEEKIGNFYIPEKSRSYHGDFYGIVTSVGEDSKLPLKEGDRILFERHEGREVEHKGEKFIVLRPDYLIAKVGE